MYAGSIPAHLGGADLSWVVGLVLTSPLYYWLATRDSAYRRRQTGAQLPSSAAR